MSDKQNVMEAESIPTESEGYNDRRNERRVTLEKRKGREGDRDFVKDEEKKKRKECAKLYETV